MSDQVNYNNNNNNMDHVVDQESNPTTTLSSVLLVNYNNNNNNCNNNKIYLPSRDYVIQRWRVTTGSAVRAGDKVAIANVVVKRTTTKGCSADDSEQQQHQQQQQVPNNDDNNNNKTINGNVEPPAPTSSLGISAETVAILSNDNVVAATPVARAQEQQQQQQQQQPLLHRRPKKRGRQQQQQQQQLLLLEKQQSTTTAPATENNVDVKQDTATPTTTTVEPSKSIQLPLTLAKRSIARRSLSASSSQTTRTARSVPAPTTKQQQQDYIALIAPTDGILRIIPTPILEEEEEEGQQVQNVAASVQETDGDAGTMGAAVGQHQPHPKVWVAFVEPCVHPQILMGMCAVCGASILATTTTNSGDPAAATFPMSRMDASINPDPGTAMKTTTLPFNDMSNISSSTETPNTSASGTTTNHDVITVSGGITMMVSEQEGQQMALQTSRRLHQQQKLSLVLDLDHTLVHATNDTRAAAFLQPEQQQQDDHDQQPSDQQGNSSRCHRRRRRRSDVRTVVLPMFEPAPSMPHQQQQQLPQPSAGTGGANNNYCACHFIKLRPHVREFLQSVQCQYEIGVYTAGTRLYAEQVTLILARFCVDATLDQPELEQLRRRVMDMEHAFRKQQQDPKAAETAATRGEQAQSKSTSNSSNSNNTTAAAMSDKKDPKVASSCTSTEDDNANDTKKESSSATPTSGSSQNQDDKSSCTQNGAVALVSDAIQEQQQQQQTSIRTRKRVSFDPTDNVGQAAADDNGDDNHQNHDQIAGVGNDNNNPNNDRGDVGDESGDDVIQDEEAPEADGGNDDGGEDVDDDELSHHRKRVRFGEPGQNSWYNNNNNNIINDQGQIVVQDEESLRNGCKPRKRVSFGEPPEPTASTSTNGTRTEQQVVTIDPVELEELRKELAEAERLEQAALKLRQQLFGSRIVSRTDVGDLGRDVKSLRRIFPCGGSMAVVVDDREDVWANALDNASGRKGEPPENLLLVRPYHWKPFLGFADVNNAAGVDLSVSSTTTSRDGTESSAERAIAETKAVADGSDETDIQLLWTRDILMRVHRKYYSKMNTNTASSNNNGIAHAVVANNTVASILSDMRAQVLQNTRIVLSALVPLRKQQQSRSLTAPRPPIVRIVESLGAKLLESVDSTVTHVVSEKDGTEKVLRARRIPTCQVVKASWLMECLWSLTKRDERPHWFAFPSSSLSMKKNKMKQNGGIIPPFVQQPSSSSSSYRPLQPPAAVATTNPAINYSIEINNSSKYNSKNSIILPLDPRADSTTSASSSSSSEDDDDDDDLAATLENELMES